MRPGRTKPWTPCKTATRRVRCRRSASYRPTGRSWRSCSTAARSRTPTSSARSSSPRYPRSIERILQLGGGRRQKVAAAPDDLFEIPALLAPARGALQAAVGAVADPQRVIVDEPHDALVQRDDAVDGIAPVATAPPLLRIERIRRRRGRGT